MTQNLPSSYPETPILNKMLENKEDSQKLGAFLDWLQNEKNIYLCKYVEIVDRDYDELRLIPDTIEMVLADYFNIDLKVAEKERVAILNHTRETSKKS